MTVVGLTQRKALQRKALRAEERILTSMAPLRVLRRRLFRFRDEQKLES